MRVVMICQDTDPIDRRIFQEAATLQAAGHRMSIIASAHGDLPPQEIVDGVEVRRLERNPAFSPAAMARLRLCLDSPSGAATTRSVWWKVATRGVLRRVKRPVEWLNARLTGRATYEESLIESIVSQGPDVIHAHDLPMLRPAVRAAEATGARVVYDAHELFAEQSFLPEAERRRWRRIERRWINRVDAAITVAPLLAEHFEQLYRVPFETITNAIDPPPGFEPSQSYDLIRRRHPEIGKRQILLYQGVLAPKRGLENLIAAVPAISTDVVVGLMGYGEYREHLQRETERHGVADRVVLLDSQAQSNLLCWTASADVGVIPYLMLDDNARFVAPNKLFEFVQAGLPILSNRLPFVENAIRTDGIGIAADLTSPARCAAAVNECFADRDRLATCRRAVRQSQDVYSWRRQAERLSAIYDRMLGTSRQLRAA